MYTACVIDIFSLDPGRTSREPSRNYHVHNYNRVRFFGLSAAGDVRPRRPAAGRRHRTDQPDAGHGIGCHVAVPSVRYTVAHHQMVQKRELPVAGRSQGDHHVFGDAAGRR